MTKYSAYMRSWLHIIQLLATWIQKTYTLEVKAEKTASDEQEIWYLFILFLTMVNYFELCIHKIPTNYMSQ